MYTVRLLKGELCSKEFSPKKSTLDKFVDPDQSEASYTEDNEIQMIEMNESQTKHSDQLPTSSSKATTHETDGDIQPLKTVETQSVQLEEVQQLEVLQIQNVSKEQSVAFEILTKDSNTQKNFLENINLNNSNHLTENELKTTVFNAIKTINKLQSELM